MWVRTSTPASRPRSKDAAVTAWATVSRPRFRAPSTIACSVGMSRAGVSVASGSSMMILMRSTPLSVRQSRNRCASSGPVTPDSAGNPITAICVLPGAEAADPALRIAGTSASARYPSTTESGCVPRSITVVSPDRTASSKRERSPRWTWVSMSPGSTVAAEVGSGSSAGRIAVIVSSNSISTGEADDVGESGSRMRTLRRTVTAPRYPPRLRSVCIALIDCQLSPGYCSIHRCGNGCRSL